MTTFPSGWTDLTQYIDTDTHIAYVDDDPTAGTGTPALVAASAVADVFNPTTSEVPLADRYPDPSSAYDAIQDGRADWVLLKRGDTWNVDERIWWDRNGPSPEARQVIAAYGPVGEPRPIIVNTSSVFGVNVNGSSSAQNRVIAHLHFRGGDVESQGIEANYGCIGMLNVNGSGYLRNVLIEGCRFEQQAKFPLSWQDQSGNLRVNDIVVRRCVFDDTHGGYQGGVGFFTGYRRLVFEENVFVETGLRWAHDVYVGGESLGLPPHTLYLQDGTPADIENVTASRNIFVEAAAYSIQARSGGRFSENLFVRIPMAIPNLGRDHYEYDGLDHAEAVGNAILHASDIPFGGGSRGWGIGVQNLEAGLVAENIIASLEGSQPFGINVSTSSPNQVDPGSVQILENIVYNNRNDALLFQDSGGLMSAHIDGNIFYEAATVDPPFAWAKMLVRSRESDDVDNQNYTFGENRYYSALGASYWFGGFAGVSDLASWLSYSGDAGGLQADDPWQRGADVTIEAFLADRGGDDWDTYDEWKDKLRTQRYGNWSNDIMAVPIINWFREGFGLDPITTSGTASINFGGRGAASSFIIMGG